MATTVPACRGAWPAAVAAVLVVADFALYIGIIVGQGDTEVGRVAFVGILLSAAAAGCVAAAILRGERARAIAAWAGTGALLSLGVLAIFSVGLPLLVAGILLLVAALRMGVPTGSVPAATVAFFVGVLVPWSLLLLG